MKGIWVIFALAASFAFVFGCTIGVFSGNATADGRPMLWKNRDVLNATQQYIYVDAEYDFVGITYQGVYNMIYGGINEAGFGIVNSNTYNHGPWRSFGLYDGQVMFLALSHCESAWDFMALLDSLLSDSTAGLRSSHCYGVIDRFGNAVMVESNCTGYVYFSAYSSTYGFLIRTNFAISGDESDRRGLERYFRARAFLEPLVPVTYEDVLAAASDLVTTELDPNPLPFEGTYDGLPFGYISTEYTINRYYTTSYQVIIGMRDGDYPALPAMWSGFGQPCATIPVPLWVGSGEVPEHVTGNNNQLCSDAMFITRQIYDRPNPTYFNTFAACAIMEFLAPSKNEIFNWFNEQITNWTKSGVDTTSLANAQLAIAEIVENNYDELHGLFIREFASNRPDGIDMNIFPNPFNSGLFIEVHSSEKSPVEIEIFDIAGRNICREYLPLFEHKFCWIPQYNMPSGVYLIRATAGNMALSKTIVYCR